MQQQCRRRGGLGFAIALLGGLASIACDDAKCPSGTTELNGRCMKLDAQSAAGNAAAGAGASAGQGASDSGASGSAGNDAQRSSGGAATGGSGGRESSGAGAAAGGADASSDPECSTDGATRCAQTMAAVERCSDGAWMVDQTCSAAEVCAYMSGTAICRAESSEGGSGEQTPPEDPAAPSGPCAGRTGPVCEGSMLYVCDGSAEAPAGESCMSEALCQIGLAAGVCAECAPDTFRCDGATLAKCSSEGRFMPQDTCASEALCNTAAGACTELVCMPNAKSCMGDGTLQTCNADGSDFAGSDVCGMGLCDRANGRCNACVPGSKTCSGSSLSTCSADGQQMNAMPCAASNDCETPTCRGGTCATEKKARGTRCTSDGGKVCDGNGKCVQCTATADCTTRFDVCENNMCVPGPGCGNGRLDPGEHCETAGPDAYERGCDPRTCKVTHDVYAVCAPNASSPQIECQYNKEQGWFCGAGGLCTHVCTTTIPGQCGSGTCVVAGGNQFCAVPCATLGSTAGCPNGSRCQDLNTGGFSTYICGTYGSADLPAGP